MTDRARSGQKQAVHAWSAPPAVLRPLVRFSLGLLAAVTLAFSGAADASEIVSYAIVQDDGSLRVQGKTIRLFGVYMPRTGRGCRTDFRPPLCGNRSVRALKTKIRGFVRCEPQAELADGSISAVCYIDGNSTVDPPVDLAAWLIEQGLAVAGPGAPFEYQTLERIAEVNRRGVWGFQVDQIIRKPITRRHRRRRLLARFLCNLPSPDEMGARFCQPESHLSLRRLGGWRRALSFHSHAYARFSPDAHHPIVAEVCRRL